MKPTPSSGLSGDGKPHSRRASWTETATTIAQASRPHPAAHPLALTGERARKTRLEEQAGVNDGVLLLLHGLLAAGSLRKRTHQTIAQHVRAHARPG